MTVGTTELYSNGIKRLSGVDPGSPTPCRPWDTPDVGAFMFVLASSAYTPNFVHDDMTDVTGEIVAGDGAPIDATTRTITVSGSPTRTRYNSDDANFGTSVTVTAKYLLCVKPDTPGSFVNDATTKLAWYVDLEVASPDPGDPSSTASDFRINQPAEGWFTAFQQ